MVDKLPLLALAGRGERWVRQGGMWYTRGEHALARQAGTSGVTAHTGAEYVVQSAQCASDGVCLSHVFEILRADMWVTRGGSGTTDMDGHGRRDISRLHTCRRCCLLTLSLRDCSGQLRASAGTDAMERARRGTEIGEHRLVALRATSVVGDASSRAAVATLIFAGIAPPVRGQRHIKCARLGELHLPRHPKPLHTPHSTLHPPPAPTHTGATALRAREEQR